MIVYSGMRDGFPSFYESYSRTAYSAIYPTERKPQGRDHCPALGITDDMPESGGGGESAAAPEVASDDDDDGGDDDGEPARSRPHSKTSPKPAHGSASPKHTVLDRSRTRHQAESPPEIKTIAIGEFALADAIGMSVDFLRKDRSGKRIIPFFRIGKSIRYNPQRVNEALQAIEQGGHKPPKPTAGNSVYSLSVG